MGRHLSATLQKSYQLLARVPVLFAVAHRFAYQKWSPPLSPNYYNQGSTQKYILFFMYFLQNKKTISSTNDNDDDFIQFTERLSLKRTIPKLSCNLDEAEIGEKQNIKDQIMSPKKYRLNRDRKLCTIKNSFEFLAKNTDLMNRTLVNATIRNQSNAVKLKIPVFQSMRKKQIKLDKIKKQQWITVHKRFTTNFTKFNDNQERKIYRSRKKCMQKSIEAFVAKQEKSQCFEGIFPMSRLNSAMILIPDKVNLQAKLILVGGLSSQMSTKLHLHEYLPTDHLWSKMGDQLPSCPQFNLSQHIVLTYQKNIFIIGGIAVIPSHSDHKNQRYNIPFISTYNYRISKWSRTNWNVYLRTHAAASFGNYAIIDGGISEQDKNSNKIFVFDMAKTGTPISVSTRGLGLSHHKIVSTQAFQDKCRSFLRFDGLFCFGGKRQDGELNDKMYLMNYDYRYNELSEKFGKFEWNPLEIAGISPQARYMHSMDLLQTKSNIFERKAYCAILGGIGENQKILNDFWLLDLSNLQWCQVSLNQGLILQNGLAGHCTAATKNKIYIFGGYNCEREYISKFWTINVENSFQASKKQHKMINKQQQ